MTTLEARVIHGPDKIASTPTLQKDNRILDIAGLVAATTKWLPKGEVFGSSENGQPHLMRTVCIEHATKGRTLRCSITDLNVEKVGRFFSRKIVSGGDLHSGLDIKWYTVEDGSTYDGVQLPRDPNHVNADMMYQITEFSTEDAIRLTDVLRHGHQITEAVYLDGALPPGE